MTVKRNSPVGLPTYDFRLVFNIIRAPALTLYEIDLQFDLKFDHSRSPEVKYNSPVRSPPKIKSIGFLFCEIFSSHTFTRALFFAEWGLMNLFVGWTTPYWTTARCMFEDSTRG